MSPLFISKAQWGNHVIIINLIVKIWLDVNIGMSTYWLVTQTHLYKSVILSIVSLAFLFNLSSNSSNTIVGNTFLVWPVNKISCKSHMWITGENTHYYTLYLIEIFQQNINIYCCRYVVSPDTLVSSTNKTVCHNITEILLKVVLNTRTLQ